MSHPRPTNLITLFATHPVAANLFMVILLLAGVWGLRQLNTQFFPDFELDIVNVSVVWPGAAAEDVQNSISIPIEQSLKGLGEIKQLTTISRQGISSMRIELHEGVNASQAKDDIEQRVLALNSLPTEAERPQVSLLSRYEGIARVLVVGDNLEELRYQARLLEQSLLDQGISKVDISGLPEQEISLQVPLETLHGLGLSLEQLAQHIQNRSLDTPAGNAGLDDGERSLRTQNQQRDEQGFRQLPLMADAQGQLLRLGDIASVSKRARENQTLLWYQGRPAIELYTRRNSDEDTLNTAKLLNTWLEDTRPTLPPNVELVVYDESWRALEDRIDLLITNGLGGLALVVLMLYLFLNARVAWWVTFGIPISFMATFAILWLVGGSINMISLFGLIMALGIIVDDAIVVGEDTLSHVQRGEPSLSSALGGAMRMFAPVVASSLTTIAAFLPLLLVGGRFGAILGDIPLVVICVIIASVLECFLILPGHLYHSLNKPGAAPSKLRQRLDKGFERFRDGPFRRLVRACLTYRQLTLSLAIAAFILAMGLFAGGILRFTFFPNVDGDTLRLSVQFSSGTPASAVPEFLKRAEQSLKQVEQEVGRPLVRTLVQHHGSGFFARSSGGVNQGDSLGGLYVELYSDKRPISNLELIRRWRQALALPQGVERFEITQQMAGPSRKAIEVQLFGSDVQALKSASLELQQALRPYNGVTNVDDDLPYGREQWILRLTANGEALGLTLNEVARQLRHAFDGRKVQVFYDHLDEVEVRLTLPDQQRHQFSTLLNLPLLLPSGQTTLLSNVAEFQVQPGLDSLNRVDGRLAIVVSSDLDDNVGNANEILASLRQSVLPELAARYGISYEFGGSQADQRETLSDMRLGLILAICLIYIILAWVFASYLWPIAVMLAIPFGLSGALFGHWLLGFDLTILSLFGCFGLSGIVINDSIVLISFYQKLRGQGMSALQAVEEAACQRLRAVLLTSLTTIAGLTPILFETSLQAQFLIPMATSIVFGLGFGTLLILLVVPSVLLMLDHGQQRWQGRKSVQSLTNSSKV
ncbi:efflux RND transporter permease subunit [Balneatrix alpica]|uniref:efflux RND transporter permease subunit n=1 Tax=Balneatrix alpica TaxID=75684 RepID=UPI0027384763|nr:efflux RND transporter permease subunit [Balneatrix alpica]